jgi:3-hydroxyacyl-[acyl-carrier-protein] dehydratase
MRFTLIDRITDLEPGRRIEAVKNLTMAEEYLAEHFPGFPVMPGVLMLEAVTQAGAWLIRATEDFKNSVILLKEAKAVKYGHFVTPGKQLRLTCEWTSENGSLVTLKAKGDLSGASSVSCRVVLERFNLADKHEAYAEQDRRLKQWHRTLFERLTAPALREKIRGAASTGAGILV